MDERRAAMNDCDTLLNKYLRKKEVPLHPEKIFFDGIGKRDVYNITAPFDDGGERVIAGRVEQRDSEYSQVYFFVNRGEKWVPMKGAPVLDLQDPFFTKVKGELIIGGVRVFPHPTLKDALGWRTVFYKGDSISDLREYKEGPDGMKDLRLLELRDGTIGVFTRPQGKKGGRGKIGFIKIASLDHLTRQVIEEAPLLMDQFIEEEWGGANELHLLSNGFIGVLGHIACFDTDNNRHYYPMTFTLDPNTGEHSEISLLATRKDFLPGEAKRPDLEDVVFSGGLLRGLDGKAEFFAGISDAEAQKISVPDPFLLFDQ